MVSIDSLFLKHFSVSSWNWSWQVKWLVI